LAVTDEDPPKAMSHQTGTAKHRILIIEDEEPIRVGLEDLLVFHGFDVASAADGRDGLHKALTGGFDLILLDLMLPGIDGYEVCERLRARDPEQPVIMLTARGTDEDIVRGLRLGADDYVAKPFSVAELVLRVQAVLRRARPEQALPLRFRLVDGTEIDAANLAARRDGATVAELTRREMETLQYLAAHTERPVPAEELLQQVWGYPKQANPETRTVAIHIAKLRRKLEPDRAEPRLLLTVRGAGYRLPLLS
jgi:two-component system response regulator RegX3